MAFRRNASHPLARPVGLGRKTALRPKALTVIANQSADWCGNPFSYWSAVRYEMR